MSPVIALFIASNYLLAMISYNAEGATTGASSKGLAAICGPPALLHLSGPISFVTCSKLNALKTLLHDAHLIGIDTETKPSLQNGLCHPTSILQLAIRSTANVESTVIVDLKNFEGNNKLSDLNDLLTPVTKSSTIIKIGQDLQDDFKQMSVAYPSLSALTAVNGLIEINWINQLIHPENKNKISLQQLALSILNCNLTKEQQMSNWDMRPLTQLQSEYAARDALILIRLFDVMICLASVRGNFVVGPLLGRLVNGKMKRSKGN